LPDVPGPIIQHSLALPLFGVSNWLSYFPDSSPLSYLVSELKKCASVYLFSSFRDDRLNLCYDSILALSYISTPSAPCELHFLHNSGCNSFAFEHDWLETYHRVHFVQKIFSMYMMNVRNIAQHSHLLSQSNSKTGPCRRKYASIPFHGKFPQTHSHLKPETTAHTMMLKGAENSWYSLSHNIANIMLFIQLSTVEFSGASIDSLFDGFEIIGPVVHIYSQHAGLTNPGCKYAIFNYFAANSSISNIGGKTK